MDSISWIIATDAGSYWGKSWGADGVTFVKANAYRYATLQLAADRISELTAEGGTHSFHIEELPSSRKWRR